jgi:hypothetical protein
LRRRTAIREIQKRIDGLLATGLIGENPQRIQGFVGPPTLETPGLIEQRDG